MTRVEEFDNFYDSTRQYALHQAYALSGDLNNATAAVKDAYAQAWRNWSKLRTRDPLSFVRSESWRQSVLHRSTPLRRRKQHDDGDRELLDALHDLPGNARRLLVLRTIGELDVDAAALEVGLTESTARSATEIARNAIESKIGGSRADVDARLRDLRRSTDEVAFERPSLARRRARKRGRRNTAGIVAASVLAVAGAGIAVTQGGPLDNVADAVGTQMPPPPPVDELAMADDDMLDDATVAKLASAGKWEVTDTGDDLSERDDLSTCPAHRFADRRAAAGWVRTFAPKKNDKEAAVQSLEVSRNETNAEQGFKQTVRWYADCAVPRLQLMDSYSVRHEGRETVIMRLRHWEAPVRTFTVGITRDHEVTSAIVHEAKGKSGPDVDAFSRTVDTSLNAMCDKGDKRCHRPGKVKPSLPPETTSATGFLGVIDLPPVAKIEELWVGTDPTGAKPNPSATQCDQANFSGKKVAGARARTFVIPESEKLPDAFGISQTIGRFDGPKAAKSFVDDVTDRIDGCADKNLSATVDEGEEFNRNGVTGKTWRVTFEVNEKETVSYRVGVMRAGNLVTQLSFSPDDKFDIRSDDFNALVERAGERLRTRGSAPASTPSNSLSSPADNKP